MNQQLVKKIFIISILFNSLSFGAHKQQSNKHNTGKHLTQNHNSQYQTHPVMMAAPVAQTQQPVVAGQTQQGIMMPQNSGQINTNNAQPINMTNNITNPYYENSQGMTITSNQISSNGMTMTIVEQLDPIKAAQLVADIYALQQNYAILSGIVEKTVNKNFNSQSFQQPFSRQSPDTGFYRINDPAFDPTKQIINQATGGYINAPAAKATAINPFTGTTITLFDLPILKQIRRLLLNNIQLMLFALGDMDACAWNALQMKTNMPQAKIWANENPNIPKAYSLNLLRPLWKQSTDYIGQGKLRIKIY